MFHSLENSARDRGRREIRLSADGKVQANRHPASSGRTLAAGLILIVCAAGAAFGPLAAPDHYSALTVNIQHGQREAFFASQPFVLAKAGNNVRSAEFPGYSEQFVEWLGADRYCVTAFMRGTCRDGRAEDMRYTCTLRREKNGAFCLESLTFDRRGQDTADAGSFRVSARPAGMPDTR